MMYFASFDLHTSGAGAVILSTAGEADIFVNLTTLEGTNQYGEITQVFNHVIDSSWTSFDSSGALLMLSMPTRSMLAEITFQLRAQATTATWTNPNTINVQLSPIAERISFSYPTGFTAIAFTNAIARRIFGFAGDFSGSSATVTGTELPDYTISPAQPGASLATPVYDDDVSAVAAYSATGRSYGLARALVAKRRSWVQQYEPIAMTYRRYNGGGTFFTYEQLYESCRAGRPFAVHDGFADGEYGAYYLDEDGDAYHPTPATPGNADQFHVPFKTIAAGRHT